MWISIRTKRVDLSPRMRDNIEAYVLRVFEREKGQIASVIVSVGPAEVIEDLLVIECRIKLWSAHLGLIKVKDVGGTVRTAVQQAALRARHAARRRLHKRRSQRRRFGAGRLGRWLPEVTAE
jgi:hypothetical protein